MRNRLFICLMAALLTASLLTGCGSKSEKAADTATADSAAETDGSEDTAAQTQTTSSLETYESTDGWQISYDLEKFQMNEKEDSVDFVYTGDPTGSTFVSVKYYPDRQPRDVLYEVTQDYDQESLVRTEGYFGSNLEDWAFTYSIATPKGDDTESRQFTAAEHNGGTLLIESALTIGSDEESNMTLSDTMADLLDTLEFTAHEAQTEFAYVPGKYTRHYQEEMEGEMLDRTESIELKSDHTGTWSAQDDITVYWTSTEIVRWEGTVEERHEYTIEGDNLYVIDGDTTLEFARE